MAIIPKVLDRIHQATRVSPDQSGKSNRENDRGEALDLQTAGFSDFKISERIEELPDGVKVVGGGLLIAAALFGTKKAVDVGKRKWVTTSTDGMRVQRANLRGASQLMNRLSGGSKTQLISDIDAFFGSSHHSTPRGKLYKNVTEVLASQLSGSGTLGSKIDTHLNLSDFYTSDFNSIKTLQDVYHIIAEIDQSTLEIHPDFIEKLVLKANQVLTESDRALLKIELDLLMVKVTDSFVKPSRDSLLRQDHELGFMATRDLSDLNPERMAGFLDHGIRHLEAKTDHLREEALNKAKGILKSDSIRNVLRTFLGRNSEGAKLVERIGDSIDSLDIDTLMLLEKYTSPANLGNGYRGLRDSIPALFTAFKESREVIQNQKALDALRDIKVKNDLRIALGNLSASVEIAR